MHTTTYTNDRGWGRGGGDDYNTAPTDRFTPHKKKKTNDFTNFQNHSLRNVFNNLTF